MYLLNKYYNVDNNVTKRRDKELPFESCLSVIPDTVDTKCWPREIC